MTHLVAGVALTLICGCSSESGDPSEGGAGSLTCAAPSCCVPMVIDPSRVFVYRNNDTLDISIDMVLSFGGQPSDWWGVDADVRISSGASVACQIGPRPSGDYDTATVYCPAVALDPVPACDSTITLELRLRTSTYPDSSGTQTLCAGSEGHRAELTVPVACPNGCTTPTNFASCDVLGQTCNYSALAYGGAGGTSTVSLPCTCQWNNVASHLAWSCRVP